MTGVNLHDFNCGFKAYKREVTDALHLYGELHRYTPVLANYYGFKIAEVTVRHHPREFGKSKYGAKRVIKGLLDLITVKFLTSYASRPLHVFGVPGILSLLVGFFIGLYLVTPEISPRYRTQRTSPVAAVDSAHTSGTPVLLYRAARGDDHLPGCT
jgi:hypothetical protein